MIKNTLLLLTGFIIAGLLQTNTTSTNAYAVLKPPPMCLQDTGITLKLLQLEAKLAESEAAYKVLQNVLHKERLDREQLAAIRLKQVTRGFRNNNPMNVHARSKNDPWLGQVGKDKGGSAIFETYQHGIRAGYLVLKNYQEKHKIDTLLKLTKRYCTGDSVRYAKFLGKKIGKKPNEKIDILQHAPALMAGIIEFENGHCPFPETYFIPYAR